MCPLLLGFAILAGQVLFRFSAVPFPEKSVDGNGIALIFSNDFDFTDSNAIECYSFSFCCCDERIAEVKLIRMKNLY